MPKATRTLPPTDYLRECFDYDPVSGELRWRHRPAGHFPSERYAKAWNKQFAGRTIRTATPKGYLQIRLNDRPTYVARIIYKMVYDIEPAWIDHIDRNRANNAISNLRSVSMQQNNRNMRKRMGAAGYPGVTICTSKPRPFYAKIRDGSGKRRSLGYFSTAEEAHAAYVAAANEIFGEHSPFAAHPNTALPEFSTITL